MCAAIHKMDLAVALNQLWSLDRKQDVLDTSVGTEKGSGSVVNSAGTSRELTQCQALEAPR